MLVSLDQKIHDIQKILQEKHIDGCLLYNFHPNNSLAYISLEISLEKTLTRRFCYWIPQKGDPVGIVHGVETHVLAHTPRKKTRLLGLEAFRNSFESSVIPLFKSQKIEPGLQ